MLMRDICPRCGQPILIGAGDCCQTAWKSGRVCGFSLPITYSGGNGKYREKVDKHTTPPASFVSEDTSWVNTVGDYEQIQKSILASGSLSFCLRYNCPALVAPLSSGGPAATVHFPRSGSDEPGRWALMPLNSRVQNLHHHYAADLSGLVPLAAGHGLVVELPAVSGGPYWVYSGGIAGENLTLAIDPSAPSGQKIVS